LVIAPHVVTVDDVRRPPLPWTRMQTFASFLEMSIPAHRGCTTSITHLTFRRRPAGTELVPGVCSGEGGEKQDSDTRAQRQQSTVPADKRTVPSTSKLNHRLTAP
jgi:hypothetical protein